MCPSMSFAAHTHHSPPRSHYRTPIRRHGDCRNISLSVAPYPSLFLSTSLLHKDERDHDEVPDLQRAPCEGQPRGLLATICRLPRPVEARDGLTVPILFHEELLTRTLQVRLRDRMAKQLRDSDEHSRPGGRSRLYAARRTSSALAPLRVCPLHLYLRPDSSLNEVSLRRVSKQ